MVLLKFFLETICNILYVFIVTFIKLNASVMNKSEYKLTPYIFSVVNNIYSIHYTLHCTQEDVQHV